MTAALLLAAAADSAAGAKGGQTMLKVLAVAISAAAIAMTLYLFIKDRLAERKALIEVRWEAVPGHEDRIALVNHGPSRAREVDFKLTDESGGEAGVSMLDNRALPLPELAAKQEFHVAFSKHLGADVAKAEVFWKDSRRGTQSSKVWLTRRHPT